MPPVPGLPGALPVPHSSSGGDGANYFNLPMASSSSMAPPMSFFMPPPPMGYGKPTSTITSDDSSADEPSIPGTERPFYYPSQDPTRMGAGALEIPPMPPLPSSKQPDEESTEENN